MPYAKEIFNLLANNNCVMSVDGDYVDACFDSQKSLPLSQSIGHVYYDLDIVKIGQSTFISKREDKDMLLIIFPFDSVMDRHINNKL